eukprot:COSAG02_NODE_219_length_28538_cov_79.322058_21_plen_176_part_00
MKCRNELDRYMVLNGLSSRRQPHMSGLATAITLTRPWHTCVSWVPAASPLQSGIRSGTQHNQWRRRAERRSIFHDEYICTRTGTYRTERRSIFHDEYICTETYRTTCREYVMGGIRPYAPHQKAHVCPSTYAGLWLVCAKMVVPRRRQQHLPSYVCAICLYSSSLWLLSSRNLGR